MHAPLAIASKGKAHLGALAWVITEGQRCSGHEKIRGKRVVAFSLGPFLAPVHNPWEAGSPLPCCLQTTCRLSVLQEGLKFGDVFAHCVWGEVCAFGRRQPVSENTETLLPVSQGGAGILWVQQEWAPSFLHPPFKM